MRSTSDPDRFGEYYFQHDCGKPYERTPEWLAFFAQIADVIVRDIRPRTVLDAGCAMGFLVEALRAQGVDAFGIDVSDYALDRVREDLKPYVRHASIGDPLSQRYDLVVNIEVLEHLSAPEGQRAIANLCQASDDILFSSSPYDFKEATHSNVQPPEYWAELFAQHGFVRDCDFDASCLTPWAVRFRRSTEPPHRIVRAFERRFWRLWKENCDLRDVANEMRGELAAKEQQLTAKNREVADIRNSDTWHLARKFQHFQEHYAPVGSLRYQILMEFVRRLGA